MNYDAHPEEEKETVSPEHEEGLATDQERLDEAMFESFPASDPPSWTTGIDKNEKEEDQ